MTNATFQTVQAINREIASLADAGVPICLGPKVTSTKRKLERINESLELRTSLGQDIEAAITNNPDLPSIYQHALRAGLESNAPELTLSGVTRESAARDELRSAAARAMVQPLIVLALAYCGFILLCALFVPELTNIYEQLRQEPSVPVRILEACRATMKIWIPLVPILVLLAFVLWRRRTDEPPKWIPGARRYLKSVKHALFAEELARLVGAKMPLAEAAQLASGTTGDAALMEACNVLTSDEDQNVHADDPRLAVLPPLVRWALTGNLGDETLPGVLSFAAQTYRQSAERMAVVWQTALPILLGGFLSGAIVMMYGLSLFWPYVQMMRDLAS
ncbi:type II secretion system F family protein [Bythopirellula polymerisocia]|uniref:Type II secretion system protein F n=1 Tax=Bythopirellula polymerisocia TaxID=2528003 RepID=A0A5C6CUG1_9BACT|nr:type II secretion system F family protein [Bythopirellula polymerisocia]TWU28058.1 Type II secretion system protein F [Bythopirellula polymerisocia]